MLIGSLQPRGPNNRELWERAARLVKKEGPSFSTACYRVYDDLWRSTTAVSAAETTAPTDAFMPVWPPVVELAVPRAPIDSQPPVPTLNSLADVLAADQLNYRALAACLSSKADLAYEADKITPKLTDFKSFRGGSTFAYGFRTAGHTFLAFRGSRLPKKGMTLSEKAETLWSDWLATDFNFIPWRWPLRHLGFVRAWERIREQVIEWLKSGSQESPQLVLTGHSLGGALALLAAFDLAKERFPIRAVITFGAPRVGLFWFRHLYYTLRCPMQTLHSVTWRFTHSTDLVSRLPPPLPYCHVGEEYVVEDWGEIEEGRPLGKISRFVEWLAGWKLKIMLWQEKFLPEKDRTIRIKESPVSEGGPPPGDVNIPFERSRDKRAETAHANFSSRIPTILGVLAQFPVLFTWMVVVGIGLLFSFAVLNDIIAEHPCHNYRNAFRKSYPNLRSEIG